MPPAIVPYRGGSRRSIPDTLCLRCGRPFRPKNRTTKYCSPECFHAAHGDNCRGKPLKPKKSCLVCGQPVRWNCSRKYCSPTCYQATLVGRKMSAEAAEKIRAAQLAHWTGKRNPGRRAWLRRVRNSTEWAEWRRAVFGRDDYTCRQCGHRGGRLHPHHIKKFSDYPELAFDVSNGMTLCEECHRETENYGNRKIGKRPDRQNFFGFAMPPSKTGKASKTFKKGGVKRKKKG